MGFWHADKDGKSNPTEGTRRSMMLLRSCKYLSWPYQMVPGGEERGEPQTGASMSVDSRGWSSIITVWELRRNAILDPYWHLLNQKLGMGPVTCGLTVPSSEHDWEPVVQVLSSQLRKSYSFLFCFFPPTCHVVRANCLRLSGRWAFLKNHFRSLLTRLLIFRICSWK